MYSRFGESVADDGVLGDDVEERLFEEGLFFGVLIPFCCAL